MVFTQRPILSDEEIKTRRCKNNSKNSKNADKNLNQSTEGTEFSKKAQEEQLGSKSDDGLERESTPRAATEANSSEQPSSHAVK